ncbi:MAG: hypothetical protein KGD59_11500 [Candidatus Heimdallarchaeota archaeon]|nr:hypothetical protein [Candidatus Heimdallarchaeota archaeon]MBY8995168.1 hypothetical protein [Candidatus Heimdallarchaeota archaeon]
MSAMNIQWRQGKPIGILAILTGFAVLTQIPMIYHAREILEVISSDYLAAYITMIIAAVLIIATAEMSLYEAILIRLRSYDIKDFRAPFLSASIVAAVYFVAYYIVYAILIGVELFSYQNPVAQYAFCQMISLLLVMVGSFWYSRRQMKTIS